METKIICYGNEKDCQCIVELPCLEPVEKRQVFEAIYGKFNQIAYVGLSDDTILIKNITDCSPHYHPENIELVVQMCEEVIAKLFSNKTKFWGQNVGDNDFEFSVKW